MNKLFAKRFNAGDYVSNEQQRAPGLCVVDVGRKLDLQINPVSSSCCALSLQRT